MKTEATSARANGLGSWHTAYQAMLIEQDTAKLFTLVEITEALIRARAEMLKETSGHVAEQKALKRALQITLALKQERLQFPV